MSISRRKRAYLIGLAKRQRRLVYVFAALLAAFILANIVPTRHNAIPNILVLILYVWSLVAMYKLVKLRFGVLKAVVAVALCCVPVLNLAIFAVAIAFINRYFLTSGLRPGILGLHPDAISQKYDERTLRDSP